MAAGEHAHIPSWFVKSDSRTNQECADQNYRREGHTQQWGVLTSRRLIRLICQPCLAAAKAQFCRWSSRLRGYPFQPMALCPNRSLLVLLAADPFHPVVNLAVALFLNGEVRHRRRRSPVPVLPTGR